MAQGCAQTQNSSFVITERGGIPDNPLYETTNIDRAWADVRSVLTDRAYRSETVEAVLAMLQFKSHIHERAYRNRPLTEQQQADNRERSSIRAKVEHVFGN